MTRLYVHAGFFQCLLDNHGALARDALQTAVLQLKPRTKLHAVAGFHKCLLDKRLLDNHKHSYQMRPTESCLSCAPLCAKIEGLPRLCAHAGFLDRLQNNHNALPDTACRKDLSDFPKPMISLYVQAGFPDCL